jgi:hypothetical protein
VKNIGCTPAETGVEPTVGNNIQSQTQKNNIPAITNCWLGSESQRTLANVRKSFMSHVPTGTNKHIHIINTKTNLTLYHLNSNL